MDDQVLEERDLSIEEYLAIFDSASVDYALIKTRSEKLSRIIIKKLRDPSGRLCEDTTFIEKSGVKYTVRSMLS
jgi:hypothetical protein